MFLATTALDEFWGKDETILFAGEWCKLYDKKNIYENLDSLTFQYQWDGLSDMDLAIKEIDLTYQKIVDSLTIVLNEYLGINQDVRYYSIILGGWLIRFIHTNFDKFLLINHIVNTYGDKLNTLILDESDYIIPLDEQDYVELVSDDYYNFQEYSKIIKFLNIKFQYRNSVKNYDQKTLFKSRKNLKKDIFFNCLNLFKNKDICISSPYFSEKKSYFKLCSKSKNIVFNDFEYDMDVEIEIDKQFRENSLTMEGSSEFEKYLSKNILQFIPALFLEGHLKLQQNIKDKNISKSKIYYNANAIQTNTVYKFFLASIHSDIKIITHQHGGGYGVDFECCDEKYERCISDIFFTFGWSDGKLTSYLPVEKLNVKPHINKEKYILLVLTSATRYIRRLYYMPKSTQIINATVESTVTFLNMVNSNSMRVRFYPVDQGWNVKKRIYDKTDKFQESQNNFSNEFKSASLVILEHIGTTFYEAIAANKPVIVYINRDMYKFRKTADDYFDQLYKVGILHFSEKECARFYLEIENNIDNWWLSESVQLVRKEFAYNFARSSKNWTTEFVETLNNVVH